MFSSIAHAGNLHLMAGGGANVSSFKAPGSGLIIGEGLNFKTDLGYYFNDQWAVEWGVQVKFNKVSDALIWDTLMTVGPRYQFKSSPHYIRAFYGKSPTVLYNNGEGFVDGGSSDRIQFDGPVWGFTVGKLYKTKKDNLWFIEGSITQQKLKDRIGIENDGDIPVETFRQENARAIEIYSVILTIGWRVF